jgi:hypothetical protein
VHQRVPALYLPATGCRFFVAFFVGAGGGGVDGQHAGVPGYQDRTPPLASKKSESRTLDRLPRLPPLVAKTVHADAEPWDHGCTETEQRGTIVVPIRLTGEQGDATKPTPIADRAVPIGVQ